MILYFSTLEPDQRLVLRRLTRHDGGKGFSPVVIDEPVVGWLSTRAEPGWRFTQRVTLPFTTINPYTPFAGGEVPTRSSSDASRNGRPSSRPPGRCSSTAAASSASPRCCAASSGCSPTPGRRRPHGGGQPRSGRVAVYLDLKAASIGEAQEPAALWTVLAQRLEDVGVLPPRAGRGAPARRGGRASYLQWLDADDGNRLLLLLDEADNFLTADSQADRRGRGAEFPTLQRLKGLMAILGPPVQGGVRRACTRCSGSTTAPIPRSRTAATTSSIGPLRSMDAYRLVVDPMNALGYTFASPELVWRLLLFTNYQASLVQIVCEALVRELSRRDCRRGGGRIFITADDVEAVYAKREVRDLIVQRFRWTINLDSRYRVIALVVALQQPGLRSRRHVHARGPARSTARCSGRPASPAGC